MIPADMTLPKTRSAAKAVLPNKPKGKRRQLEFDQGPLVLDNLVTVASPGI